MLKVQVNNCLRNLNASKIFLYPTYTLWGIGCDATNENAVSKIYKFKQRYDSKALICFVKNSEMLSNYVEEIPEKAFSYLDNTDRPTSINYPKAKTIAQNLIAEEGSIAIRICRTEYCQQLFEVFGKSIVSTSSNLSGTPTPQNFEDIQDEILKGVDYIVNLQRKENETTPSRIARFDEERKAHVLRD